MNTGLQREVVNLLTCFLEGVVEEKEREKDKVIREDGMLDDQREDEMKGK